DLRHFLARLGGLADATDGPGSGPAWPLLIAATTALVLAHRASYGPRRRFRRPVAAAAWAAGHGPVPGAPWPLGPPRPPHRSTPRASTVTELGHASVAVRAGDRCALRWDRPKRATVALRASVSSDRRAQDHERSASLGAERRRARRLA